MTGGDEEFFAWLDGELTGAQAAAVEARVLADPDLARLADQHRRMSQRMRSAFDPIIQAPLPDELAEAAHTAPAAAVIDLGHFRHKRATRSFAPVQWFAIAASLVIGIVTGTTLNPGAGPVRSDQGQLYAAASLEQSLDRQLASSQQGAAMRIGITFRDQAGALCRSFNGQRISGLACREGDRWQVRGLVGQPESAGGDYRMASGTDPQIASMVGAIIAGAPLNADEERAARDKDWR